ncbi:hypothetical protein [Bradyrhizobium elkanii]|uniref:hypothetical protein n=1 Tax=Bradyrhizobium elkanii TaxID=29448 RepID=UPI0004134273|nr:hypothetical protein [Bradyrhizobium elkanii]
MTTKILLAAIALAALTSDGSAQQRSYYDSSGRSVGRSATDSQGTTTFYDAAGSVTGRASRSGNTTRIYDSRGRTVGRSTGGAAR